ncbi:MAG: hypothetical protein WA705_21635 [Candidatus Ozemobacteraceae bacterium]
MSPSELFEIAVDMIMAVEELKKINADDEMRAFLEDCEKARRDELCARSAARREGLGQPLFFPFFLAFLPGRPYNFVTA